MTTLKLNFLIILAILILIVFSFYIKDFRIDASSDTLVAQDDAKILNILMNTVSYLNQKIF